MRFLMLQLQYLWRPAVEFTVSSWALYVMLDWARRARATRIALVALSFYVAGAMARRMDLPLTGWFLQSSAVLLAVSILLILQTEIRSALMRFDLIFTRGTGQTSAESGQTLAETAFRLSRAGLGALIVVRARDALSEAIHGGSALSAPVSAELLLALFQKTSPLHDGAIVVEGDRIERIKGILPLTRKGGVPARFGTRHRAALGLSEVTDARIVVVSEERGEVSLVQAGQIQMMATPEELAAAIRSDQATSPSVLIRIGEAVLRNIRWKAVAAALAALLVALPWLYQASAVRTLSASLEFEGIPPDVRVATQSADHVDLELRGPSWLLEALPPSLVVHANLAGASQGTRTVSISRESIELPPEVELDRIMPTAITVRLEKRTNPEKQP